MSSRLIDAALAVLAIVVSTVLLVSTLGDSALRGPRWCDALLAIAATAPIAWARRFALEATGVTIAATVAYAAVAAPADPGPAGCQRARCSCSPLPSAPLARLAER